MLIKYTLFLDVDCELDGCGFDSYHREANFFPVAALVKKKCLSIKPNFLDSFSVIKELKNVRQGF